MTQTPAAFVWCGCCHRVYPAAWWIENGEECPDPTCEGTLDDAWAWGEALLMDQPAWSEMPEPGERYPL